jgi:hypothetical protein
MTAGESWETAKNNVQTKIKGICFTAWKFWPLVHCITYGVIPARHRILWVNCVDLVWNAILATMSRTTPLPVQAEAQAPSVVVASLLESNGESGRSLADHQRHSCVELSPDQAIVLGQDLLPSAVESLFNATSTQETAA